jgi:predicted kinase
MPAANPILIVTGPPGAGKTTTARLVASARERSVHLESDRFFHFIQSGYVEPWRPESHAQNSAVMEIVAGAAAAYADEGYFTVVDGIVSPRWFLEPMHGRLASLGHPVAYGVLRAPLAVCVARASERVADTAVVEQLWHEFADLGSLEHHAIDTAALSPEQAAQALADGLRGALLLSTPRARS